ncbi:hypothetical protein D3C83_76010 [compost metagenome]
MKPKMRCMRYSEVSTSRAKPSANMAPSAKKCRPFMPPRNRMPKVVTAITTSAPKSGSRSKSHDTNIITASIGISPRRKLFITACLRTV